MAVQALLTTRVADVVAGIIATPERCHLCAAIMADKSRRGRPSGRGLTCPVAGYSARSTPSVNLRRLRDAVVVGRTSATSRLATSCVAQSAAWACSSSVMLGHHIRIRRAAWLCCWRDAPSQRVFWGWCLGARGTGDGVQGALHRTSMVARSKVKAAGVAYCFSCGRPPPKGGSGSSAIAATLLADILQE